MYITSLTRFATDDGGKREGTERGEGGMGLRVEMEGRKEGRKEGRRDNLTGGTDTHHTHVPRQIRDNCDSKTTHGNKESGTREREMHVLHRGCCEI